MKPLSLFLVILFIGFSYSNGVNCHTQTNTLEILPRIKCETETVCAQDCTKIIKGCKYKKLQHFKIDLQKNFLDHMTYRDICIMDSKIKSKRNSKPKVIQELERNIKTIDKRFPGNTGDRLSWALRRVVHALRIILRICRMGPKSDFLKRYRRSVEEIRKLKNRERNPFAGKGNSVNIERMKNEISKYKRGEHLSLEEWKSRSIRAIGVHVKRIPPNQRKYFAKYRDMFIKKFEKVIMAKEVSNEGFCTCERISLAFNGYVHKLENLKRRKSGAQKKEVARVVFEDIAGAQGTKNHGKEFYRDPKLVGMAIDAYGDAVTKLATVYQTRRANVRKTCERVCQMSSRGNQGSKGSKSSKKPAKGSKRSKKSSKGSSKRSRGQRNNSSKKSPRSTRNNRSQRIPTSRGKSNQRSSRSNSPIRAGSPRKGRSSRQQQVPSSRRGGRKSPSNRRPSKSPRRNERSPRREGRSRSGRLPRQERQIKGRSTRQKGKGRKSSRRQITNKAKRSKRNSQKELPSNSQDETSNGKQNVEPVDETKSGSQPSGNRQKVSSSPSRGRKSTTNKRVSNIENPPQEKIKGGNRKSKSGRSTRRNQNRGQNQRIPKQNNQNTQQDENKQGDSPSSSPKSGEIIPKRNENQDSYSQEPQPPQASSYSRQVPIEIQREMSQIKQELGQIIPGFYKKIHHRNQCCQSQSSCCQQKLVHSNGESYVSLIRKLSRRTRQLARNIERRREERRRHQRTRRLVRRMEDRLN